MSRCLAHKFLPDQSWAQNRPKRNSSFHVLRFSPTFDMSYLNVCLVQKRKKKKKKKKHICVAICFGLSQNIASLPRLFRV